MDTDLSLSFNNYEKNLYSNITSLNNFCIIYPFYALYVHVTKDKLDIYSV